MGDTPTKFQTWPPMTAPPARRCTKAGECVRRLLRNREVMRWYNYFVNAPWSYGKRRRKSMAGK